MGDDLLDGKWFEVFADPYIGVLGEAGLALMISGTSTAVILTWTRSLTLTGTWLILLSGFFVMFLPTPAATIIVLLITVLLAAAFYSVYASRLVQ